MDRVARVRNDAAVQDEIRRQQHQTTHLARHSHQKLVDQPHFVNVASELGQSIGRSQECKLPRYPGQTTGAEVYVTVDFVTVTYKASTPTAEVEHLSIFVFAVTTGDGDTIVVT